MDMYARIDQNKITAKISAEAGAVYYATVRAYGEDANHRLTLRLTDGERVLRGYSYFVSAQKTDIFLPFTASGEERFVEVISEDGGIFYAAEPRIEKSSDDYFKTISGSFLVPSDEWQSRIIPAIDERGLVNGPTGEDGIPNGRDRALDCIIIGDYMYTLCNGKLHTLRRSGESFSWIGATERLGELRQLAATEDGRGLIVTARNYGLYSFDLADPEHPKVASRIDSLEMATGLDICGKYLFVADRTFGVDILDISDIYHPKFISNIPTGETQDVCYSQGYVYAGVWAECKVRICDVRDADNPKEVGEVHLSGRGDGVFVKDGYLYAATGQFGLGEHLDREHPGYGLGNGLEIWDVRDYSAPRRLSVLRADGASYPGNPDLWRTYTSGNYLFFTSVHSGAYIYDITDRSSPRRLVEMRLTLDKPNDLWNEKHIFPHTRGKSIEEAGKPIPIVDTWVEDDRVYLCTGHYGSGNNLFEVKLPFKVGVPDSVDHSEADLISYGGGYYLEDHSIALGDSVRSYVTDSQVKAVAVCGDYLYLAAGTRGVVVLDKHTLRELSAVPSFDITRDVKIRDGYLYTAESTAGVAVYKIDESSPERLTLVGQSPIANVVELMLSPDARFAVAHISNVQGLVDLRDKTCPKLYYMNREFHMVYQNQLSLGCIADRYITASATKGKIQIYDFGAGGSLPEPEIIEIIDKTPITGMLADGDCLLLASGRNLYRTELEAIPTDTPLCPRLTPSLIDGMLTTPVLIGDLLFSIKRKQGEYLVQRINEARDGAVTLLHHTFRGNPGITVTDGERYYLPLGYGGVVSFKI